LYRESEERRKGGERVGRRGGERLEGTDRENEISGRKGKRGVEKPSLKFTPAVLLGGEEEN